MSPSLLAFILIVTPNGVPDAEAVEIATVVRQVLNVEVRTISASSAELEGLEETSKRLRAEAAVELSWASPDRGLVKLRAYIPRDDRWVRHSMHFEPSDSDSSERTRAVGFAIASLIPQPGTTEHREERLEPPPPEKGAPRPEVGGAAPPLRREWAEPLDNTRSFQRAWDLSVHAAQAFGGDGGGLGGGLGASLTMAPRFSLRIGGLGRLTDVEGAHASATMLAALLGVRYGTHGVASRPFGWGVRGDLLLATYRLTRMPANTDAGAQHRSGTAGGVSISVEGCWAVARQLELVIDTGGEALFGTGEVYVQGRLAATIAPVRAFASAGLRMAF